MSPTIIEKLLKGAEVEWKPLGEIVKIKTGALVNKNTIQNNPGVYPVINSGKEPLGFIKYWNTECDPIGITTRGAGVGSVTWQEGRYFRGNLNYSVTIKDNKKLLVRYLFYSLTSQQKDIQNLATYSGIPALNAAELKKLRVPMPPLSVQKEIVRILDAFTAHTAELTAELNERKKQYNYYRDKLLTFSDDEVEWKTVEEIITTVTPPLKIPRGKYNLSGNIPIVDQGENFIAGYTDNADAALPENEYIIFGDHTEYIKYVDFSFAQGADGLKILKPNRDLAKYVYYAFLNFYNKTGNYKRHWTDAKKILLPIVSIKAQKRIVSILDKFDALATSISEGLPREIELRNKQYEYYRDQLLNFPKPENNAIKQSPTNL